MSTNRIFSIRSDDVLSMPDDADTMVDAYTIQLRSLYFINRIDLERDFSSIRITINKLNAKLPFETSVRHKICFANVIKVSFALAIVNPCLLRKDDSTAAFSLTLFPFTASHERFDDAIIALMHRWDMFSRMALICRQCLLPA